MSALKYEHIAYFIEVCQAKSIAGAASNLFISQQALSSSIKRLEKELGTELFHRSVCGVQLTETGLRLCKAFEPIVRSYQNAVQQCIAGNTNHVLTLCVAQGVIRNLTLELLLEFGELNSGTKIDVIETSDAMIEQSIRHDKHQTGILAAPEWLIEKRFKYVPLRTDPGFLVVHRSNPLSEMPCVSLAALKHERVLAISKNDFYQEALNGAVAPFGFSVTPVYESKDIMALLAMVNRGIGTLICGQQAYEEAVLNSSARIPILERTLDFCTAVVFQDYAELTPLTKKYISFIQKSVNAKNQNKY